MKIDLFVLVRPLEPFDEDVVASAATSIMLMRMPRSSKALVNAALVNCAPWSVFMIVGQPNVAMASSSAAVQKLLSSVSERRQLSPPRLALSITATR